MNDLPKLRKGEFFFEGSIHLNSWDDFHLSANKEKASRLNVCILDPEASDTEDYQKEAVKHLFEHQYEIRQMILNRLLAVYPEWREEFGYSQEELNTFAPQVTEADDFKKLIELRGVHILKTHKDGVAYTGLLFNCSWDDEHGLGAMIHKNSLIELGHESDGIMEWIAKNDGGISDTESMENESVMQARQKVKGETVLKKLWKLVTSRK